MTIRITVHDGDTDDNDDVDNIMIIMIKTTLLIHKSHFDSFKGVVLLTPRRPPQESYFDFFWVDTCRVILALLIESFWLPMESLQNDSWKS